MEELRERIKKDGVVLNDRILKVDSFLNHQCDPMLIMKIGEAIAKRFEDEKPTKVLTIEASGIHVAFATALVLQIPFVFAKKKPASTQQGRILFQSIWVPLLFDFSQQISKDLECTLWK